jgi:hypothetical protein
MAQGQNMNWKIMFSFSPFQSRDPFFFLEQKNDILLLREIYPVVFLSDILSWKPMSDFAEGCFQALKVY